MLPTENLTINVPKHNGKITLDKGFFIISINKKESHIEVEYYENATDTNNKIHSGKLRMKFKGKSGRDLYRGILLHDFISTLDHAAYLGYELRKAEDALNNNHDYIQDKD